MAEGHRQRLKKRFLEYGLEGLDDHNILELLLFFACPRADTNPLAHELMNKFGSLSGVFDASLEDLVSVVGVKQHAATLLKLIPALSGCYMADRVKNECPLTSRDAIGRYLVGKFSGREKEAVILLLFNSKKTLITTKILDDGSACSANINIRAIAELALAKHATSLVIAHNHPHGLPVPSPDDIRVTEALQKSLMLIDVELVDHFIIADNRFGTVLNIRE